MDFSVIRLLILVLVGYGVMLGLISRRRLGRYLARLLIFPIIFAVLWSVAGDVWARWTWLERAELVGLLLFGLLLVMLFGTRFGRDVLAGFLGHVLHDMVVSIFRLAVGTVRLVMRIFQRRKGARQKST